MSKPSLKTRLTRLEQAAGASDDGPDRKTEEHWADWFAVDGACYCESEPDRALVLANLLSAIESTPGFEPPKDFLPGESIDHRRIEWRRTKYFPEVRQALFWMFEMVRRVLDGKPPVTLAEFRDLESWFHSNETRVPIDGLKIQEMKTVYRASVRASLTQGPMGIGVTELVEDLRLLKMILT